MCPVIILVGEDTKTNKTVSSTTMRLLSLSFEYKIIRELKQFLGLFMLEKLLKNTFRLLFLLSYSQV